MELSQMYVWIQWRLLRENASSVATALISAILTPSPLLRPGWPEVSEERSAVMPGAPGSGLGDKEGSRLF